MSTHNSGHYEQIQENLFDEIETLHNFFKKTKAITDIRQITHRRCKLEEIYSKSLETQEKINSGIKYPSSYQKSLLDDAYFACYDASLKAENELLKKLDPIPAKKSTLSSTLQQPLEKEVSQAPPAPSLIDTQSSAQITIELPKFNGDYKNWKSFYEIFKYVVHNNEKIPQINKFEYLQSCLEGEASSAVEDSAPSEYLTTWNKLVTRYEKPRLIVDAHLKELFDLPKLTNGSSLEIRGLANKARQHVNAITAMNYATDEYLFVFLIGSKLDKATKKLWELSSSDNERPSWNNLMEFLDNHAKEDESNPVVQNTA